MADLLLQEILISNDGDVSGHHGWLYDYWIVKLDTNGNIVWQKSLGGSDDDEAYSIQQTTDGGFIVAGYSIPMMETFQEIMALVITGS